MRALVVVLFLVGLAALPAAAGPEHLPRELQAWIAAQPGLPDFTVAFQMTRKLPALRDPVTAEGALWRLRDGRFKWQVGQPATSIVTFDGQTLKSWETGSAWKQLDEEGRRAQSWLMFMGSQNDTLRELDRRFTVRVIESSPATVIVALDPRSAMTRKYLREIRLQWDPKTHHLKSLKILQGNESETHLQFRAPEPIHTLPEELAPPRRAE